MNESAKAPLVAVVVFPGTNSETETVDACRDAGMDARLFWWSDDPQDLRRFDAFVLSGGFAHEDRVRAGAIAARSPLVDVIREEAGRGKLVLGLCNGAQVVAEAGLIGDVAIARNLPAHRFQCRFVDVVADAEPDRCAFTRGLLPGATLRMVAAHAEGRFTGDPAYFDGLEERSRIVLRYAGAAHNGAMHRAAGICNDDGNVLALMPHPERAAWTLNVAFDDPSLRGGDPNRVAGAHAIFSCMARSLRERTTA
ncbi:MAG TPA: phosphoribosylformylglycinamidine synthase I [Candidatus Eremiobacteraceae bacterium]|nr:phosphoribosylformylglycinamidine synthase I [Candidatus Eremiobacteraceae bacterium]